jgi:PiT family inorganic phosphate transporter
METVQTALWVIVLLVALALVFDFMNGFHDAANSIATVVSTGVLKPGQAVLFAAFFNFIAIFVFHLSVAATMGKGIVQPGIVDTHVVFGALSGRHHLELHHLVLRHSQQFLARPHWRDCGRGHCQSRVGGTHFFGRAQNGRLHLCVAIAGLCAGVCDGGGGGMDLPPRHAVSGWTAGFGACNWCLPGPTAWATAATMRKKPLASSGCCSSPPATPLRGDASPPGWVIVCCYTAIALGTMFGGWRIVKTMGQKITKLKPVGGFCAETGGAMTLFMATMLGIPVSTTHTITGAIVGVGSVQRASAVRWGVAGNIIWAWILTIPCQCLCGRVGYWVSLQIF